MTRDRLGSTPPPDARDFVVDSPKGATADVGGYEGCLLGGTFRIGKLLGSGAASEVYEAKDEASGDKWAVKVLLPKVAESEEQVARFKREAKAAARMRHPHVVHVEKLVEDPGAGVFFIVMDLLRGETLAETLGRLRVPPPLAFVGDVMLPTLGVFALAHERGILHRDIKPQNVFLSSSVGVRFVPQVLDFGLARMQTDTASSVTSPSMVRGTADYMSPEQGQSLRDVGPASDVYSLGCVLTELLQLRTPFASRSLMEVFARHLVMPPPQLDRPLGAEPIPERLEALRLAMLAKAPGDRPTTAAVRDELAKALADAGVPLGKFELPKAKR